MPVTYINIINRNGGLAYAYNVASHKRTDNEELELASSYYAMCLMAAKISPVSGSSGINMIQTSTFLWQSFKSRTGVIFCVMASPNEKNLDNLLRIIYRLYADYVMKTPFYQRDQPIRIPIFDSYLLKLLSDFTAGKLASDDIVNTYTFN